MVSRGGFTPASSRPPRSGQGEKRTRGGELDSPDERHHLLHDVFAEGDDDEEFLWEETAAASASEQLQTSGSRQVRPNPDR